MGAQSCVQKLWEMTKTLKSKSSRGEAGGASRSVFGILANIEGEAVLLVTPHVGIRHEEEGILVLPASLR